LSDLSVGRFALCFRASTGVSPHRFVLSRRVEAAMGLLRDSPMPMVDVAIACGFSSQQHMATMMRRLARVVPSSVRHQATRGDDGAACDVESEKEPFKMAKPSCCSNTLR
jgi:AraC family transcriptional regulator